ncbi:hypothetical protein HFN_0717 [Helicobacter fennelliae MRY12-0050]|uniref:Uncharacterized protein n=1 Tax=Helicobacter fennelliae MRY12-0050 TaxID=1325130 RepID=T1DWK1_9HELI|nr:hypothetical protein HFN_0715 [Helicobacter fennelliae MRY12-0050]GAD19477.1 hypothetical protein HFN_0717 [Helicobacter fennelliae MRY12-0050]
MERNCKNFCDIESKQNLNAKIVALQPLSRLCNYLLNALVTLNGNA